MKVYYLKFLSSKKASSLLAIVLLLPILLFAQSKAAKTVTGKVIDTKGNTVIGATVKIKEGSGTTLTDVQGAYSIQAKEGDILIFSSIGYTTAEVTINQASVYNVKLEESIANLEDVVVIGYGKGS
ncbi:carboxypeptidase-like regulatory domain-containing protein, partial [Arcticibacter svalbardensis]|uniref:carboxypeptidase-like regulatory domain-containing protein n=1 Tax=Arcticibacter svalbardensis TaxID=1288027 RepID=UPI00058ADDA0